MSDKKQTAFRISESLLKRLKAEAKKQNRSLNNLVEGDDVIRVSEVDSPYWTSKDAKYTNRLYTMLDAWNYYRRNNK